MADMVQYTQDVKEKEGIDIATTADFKFNPGLRQLSKLMLNNLWGRYGMKENLVQSVFVTSFGALLKYFQDESVEVTDVRIMTPQVVQILFRKVNNSFLPMSRDTNIFIAIFTTA